MRSFEERVADGRDEIVERIAHQLSALRPCASTALGPAEVTAHVAALVDAFLEALRTRRSAPFVETVRASAAAADGAGDRLAAPEVHVALELLEDLAVQSLGSLRDRANTEAAGVIRAVIGAGREVVPRESRLEPGP